MPAPILVYYQLDNFYQNHRRYVSSRSDGQLRGDLAASTAACADATQSLRTIKMNVNVPLDNITEPQEYILNPCGLIANSLFNGRHNLRTPMMYVWWDFASHAHTDTIHIYKECRMNRRSGSLSMRMLFRGDQTWWWWWYAHAYRYLKKDLSFHGHTLLVRGQHGPCVLCHGMDDASVVHILVDR